VLLLVEKHAGGRKPRQSSSARRLPGLRLLPQDRLIATGERQVFQVLLGRGRSHSKEARPSVGVQSAERPAQGGPLFFIQFESEGTAPSPPGSWPPDLGAAGEHARPLRRGLNVGQPGLKELDGQDKPGRHWHAGGGQRSARPLCRRRSVVSPLDRPEAPHTRRIPRFIDISLQPLPSTIGNRLKHDIRRSCCKPTTRRQQSIARLSAILGVAGKLGLQCTILKRSANHHEHRDQAGGHQRPPRAQEQSHAGKSRIMPTYMGGAQSGTGRW